MHWFRAVWFGGACAIVVAIIYLSVTSHPVDLHVPMGDKIGHLTAYAVATWWLAHLQRASATRWATAAGLIGLGIMMELVQLHLGYRTFEVQDIAANSLGVAVGWMLSPPRTPNLLQPLAT
jgi:VanZ family protein